MNWYELVPLLETEFIRTQAERFWSTYNSDQVIPLPIEEIVEFQLGINIVPLPGLSDAFQIEGYISSDLSEISVDLGTSERWPERYRFTIAHEMGHLFLHHDLYRNSAFNNTQEWRSWVAAMPQAIHARLETQASMFARMVLAPRRYLVPAFEGWMGTIEASGLELSNYENSLCRKLGKQFGISQQAMKYCLINEGLIEPPRR